MRNEYPSPKRAKRNSSTELEEHWEPEVGDTGIVDDFVMPLSPKGASVEGEDSDDGGNTHPTSKPERFIESYSGNAGKRLRKSKTRFELWFKNQKNEEKIPWFSFACEREWALTMWLIKNVGHKSMDEFLKLQIVSKL